MLYSLPSPWAKGGGGGSFPTPHVRYGPAACHSRKGNTCHALPCGPEGKQLTERDEDYRRFQVLTRPPCFLPQPSTTSAGEGGNAAIVDYRPHAIGK